MNAHLLESSRKAAFELFRTSLGPNAKTARSATACLLELSVYSTSLLADASLVRADAVRAASKDYPWFPMLLASGKGRDTQQKLRQIESLPIGENWPFKRFQGKARNDNLWRTIESEYGIFEYAIRRRHAIGIDPSYPISDEGLGNILVLPSLSKKTSRKWARVIATRLFTGPGGAELMRILGIKARKETTRKAQRKIGRLRTKFGGTELETDKQGATTRFFPRNPSGERGEELDAVTATKLNSKIQEAERSPITDADSLNAFTDEIEKRLRSRLKK